MADNRAFDWDDEIAEDGEQRQFITLTEGDYVFTVVNLEKGFYNGGAKLPACPQATLELEIDTDDGTAKCFTKLFLCESQEWKLKAFFRSVGLMKHGEKGKMPWSQVIGASGKAHFAPREYDGKNYNDLKYYIDASEDGDDEW